MMNKTLNSRVAIITGASQGLGLQIAKHYLSAGANLVLCARNHEHLKSATLQLGALLSKHQKIFSIAADVSSESDVNNVLNLTLEKFGTCHILVNNAGIYGPMGTIEDVDIHDWIRAIQVNLFGSVLMSRAVVPLFKKQKYGKLIQLSGGGATAPLPSFSAYAASKAAVVRYAETLAEELREFNVDVNAIAPGALNTRMLDEVIDAGPEKVGKKFYDKSLQQKEGGGSSLELAANLAVFLASSASDGISGKIISAAWDRWEEWSDHIKELKHSDAYTLRRIIGRDRGFDWGDK
jgi:3-oxoacyl-[acyl-carrier protein] reductase